MKINNYIHRNIWACLILGIALSFVACSDDSTDEPLNGPSPAIGFFSNQIEEIGTRALVTVDNLKSQKIGVYGYKKKADDTDHMLVFDNTELSHNGSSWNYTPLRYWDLSRSYSFLAYIPYETNDDNNNDIYNVEYGDAGTSKYTDILTFKNIQQWQKIDGNETDYLVASSASSADNYINNNKGTVNLVFKHIYAQLLISVKKDIMGESTTTHTVTGLRFGEDSGSEIPDIQPCTYQHDANNAANSKVTSTRTNGKITFLDNGNVVADVTEVRPLAHYLVAPFTTQNSASLYIDYTVSDGSNTTTHNNVKVEIGKLDFKSNNKYTYVLRFEAGKPILVSIAEVKEWESEEVTDEVYNW
ncbi:MAG: fimbrillin family protein [Prevotella sp.]|nr:fimbrillin family protein [Prevotella sp.]